MAIRESDILMEELRLKQTLRDSKVGAYYDARETGEHYLLSSGRHTGEFYQMAKAFRFAEVRRLAAGIIIEKIRNSPLGDSIDVLVGIAMGGIPLLYELQRDPFFMRTEAVWVEREQDPDKIRVLKARRAARLKKEIPVERSEFILGRNFRIDPDKRVLLVDDVMSTGGSIRAAIDACSDYNNPEDPAGKEDPFADANIVGIVVAVNRMPADADMLKISPVMDIIWALRDSLNSWVPDECPFDPEGISLKRI